MISEQFKQKMTLTPHEKQDYKAAANCHIFGKPVEPKDRVGDHCHIPGGFRGLTHLVCNTNYYCLQESTLKVPVLFHNLRGYASFLLVEAFK